MKLKNLVLIFGWSCIIAGLTSSYFSKETQEETKEIAQVVDHLDKDKKCIKEMLFHEARNTSKKEQHAIIDVVLNRTRSNKYPNEICKVINQPWQFSYKNNPKNILPEIQNISGKSDREAFISIDTLVEDRFNTNSNLKNKVLPEKALWYHLKKMPQHPSWKKSKNIRAVAIDKSFKHVYYRDMM